MQFNPTKVAFRLAFSYFYLARSEQKSHVHYYFFFGPQVTHQSQQRPCIAIATEVLACSEGAAGEREEESDCCCGYHQARNLFGAIDDSLVDVYRKDAVSERCSEVGGRGQLPTFSGFFHVLDGVSDGLLCRV